VQVPCTSRSQILIDAAPMGRALLRGVSDLHRDPVSVCRRPSARTIAVVSLTITRWPHLPASGTPSGPVTYTTPRGRGPEHPMTPAEQGVIFVQRVHRATRPGGWPGGQLGGRLQLVSALARRCRASRRSLLGLRWAGSGWAAAWRGCL
jgi:hypothetical protein